MNLDFNGPVMFPQLSNPVLVAKTMADGEVIL